MYIVFLEIREKVFTMKLSKGYYIIGGRASIKPSGSIEIFGGEVSGRTVEIPYARQAPVYIHEKAEVEIDGGYIVQVNEDPIPIEWKASVEDYSPGDKAVIIGGVDVGKSGYTLFVANQLVKKGYTVGIIDTDIGQSDLGPPGTIGSSIVKEQYVNYHEIPLYNAYFIGDKMPSGHLLQIVVGTHKLVKEIEPKVDVLIVNTSGYIRGGVARALKRYIVEVVEPTEIYVFDREGETRHITDDLKAFNIKYLPIPKTLKPKRIWERREYRNYYLRKYIKEAGETKFKTSNLTFDQTILDKVCYRIYRGYIYGTYQDGERTFFVTYGSVPKEIVSEIFRGLEIKKYTYIDIKRLRGLLLGLYKEGIFLNIGLLLDYNPITREIKVLTKIDDEPDEIKFGYLIVDSEFNEVMRLRPGFLG